MNLDVALRLTNLRARVITATREALKEDGHHKSSEGATELTVSLPSMFSDDQRPTWTVSIYSYVLGPNRTHDWHGASPEEAISKAEDAVDEWCRPLEMKAFAEAMGLTADEPGEDYYETPTAQRQEPGQ